MYVHSSPRCLRLTYNEMGKIFSSVRLVFAVILCCVGLYFPAHTYNLTTPLDITADRLDVNKTSSQAIFSGNVNATQDGLNVQSNSLALAFANPKELMLKSVMAEENVIITHNGTRATSDKATLNPATNILTLEGNVTLTKGENTLKGTRLVYNLTTEDIQLLNNSGQGRVRAVINANTADKSK